MRFGEVSEQERLRRLHGLRSELADATTAVEVAQVVREVAELILGGRAELSRLPVSASRWRPTGCTLPLVVGPRAIGAIDFAFDEERELDDVERRFLSAVAQAVADALERTLEPKRYRVMIVDDNADDAAQLGEALEALGHEAVVVYNAHAALRAAEEFDAHLAIVAGVSLDASALRTVRESTRLVEVSRPVQVEQITALLA